MMYIIDRFEGNIAVCEIYETEYVVRLNKNDLPEECKEGDVIEFKNGIYYINLQETKKREKIIKDKLNSLWD